MEGGFHNKRMSAVVGHTVCGGTARGLRPGVSDSNQPQAATVALLVGRAGSGQCNKSVACFTFMADWCVSYATGQMPHSLSDHFIVTQPSHSAQSLSDSACFREM